MRRSALLLAALLVAAACGTNGGTSSTTSVLEGSSTAPSGFPVAVTADNGEVMIEARPAAIVSLSSVATEMLFAIDAGDQVVAVDDQSNYPPEAPSTDLSGFTPNVEAVLSFEPDLVVISFDPGGVVDALQSAEVPVLVFGAAPSLADAYGQIAALGLATGHSGEADDLVEGMRDEFQSLAASAPDGSGTTYFHEIDNTLYTLTSSTLFGEIYSMFGLENVADAADSNGSGYPQLSAEFLVSADPDIIFLADSLYGESAETVAARPGWGEMTAVLEGDIYELDSDVASRWGPRLVDFARSVSEAVDEHLAGG